jgi:hypothetical protein
VAEVQHGLVKHSAHLLCRIGDALPSSGEHCALDLLVTEAREYGDDHEDESRDEKRQLAAKRLLREEGRHERDCGTAESGGFSDSLNDCRAGISVTMSRLRGQKLHPA